MKKKNGTFDMGSKAYKDIEDIIKKSGSSNYAEASANQQTMAQLAQAALREGIMDGDNLGGIYFVDNIEPGVSPNYPLSFLTPGTEKDFAAYTMPQQGAIPERSIEGDEVYVKTYEIANSIGWPLKYARQARWPMIAAALNVLEAGIVKKLNDDGWHTILGAALDRGLLVVDSAAVPGQFTRKLISLVKLAMRRNGGGNSTSVNRSKLTDLYVSAEAMEDIRNWGADEVDEVTRRELLFQPDGTVGRIYNVNIHDFDELGEGQSYQSYYTDTLSGTMGSGDLEICVGVDLSKEGIFIMPVDQPLEVTEDPMLHRKGSAGYYARQGQGFMVGDSRAVILGSF